MSVASCGNCEKEILNNQSFNQLLGNLYHSDCLICQKCNSNLWLKPFVKKGDGKLYCDYNCSNNKKQTITLPPIHLPTAETNNENQFQFKSYFDFNSPEQVLPILSNSKNEYSLPNGSNGFEVRKPTRPKPAPEPFFYNQRPNSFKPPKVNIEYNLNSPYASTSLNEFDKNIFLSQRKLVVLKKLKPDHTIKPEPFSYNKQMQNDSNMIKSYNVSCPPFALHSNYLQVIQNRMNDSEEVNDICLKCNTTIKAKQELFVHKNKKFHKKCFKCARCPTDLIVMKKIMADPNNENDFYCEQCYSDKYSPRCAKCNQAIAPYMLSTTYDNNAYHKECFYCQRCKKFTSNEQYYKTGKMILCRNCL